MGRQLVEAGCRIDRLADPKRRKTARHRAIQERLPTIFALKICPPEAPTVAYVRLLKARGMPSATACQRQESCMRGEPVSRILSKSRSPLDDHSSRPRLAAALKLPTRIPGAEAAPAGMRPPRDPYLALLPVGLAVPVRLPVPRWALTPPFHPDLCGQRRSVFCGAVRRIAPPGRYPAPLLRGVRTFLAALRPRGHPALRASVL